MSFGIIFLAKGPYLFIGFIIKLAYFLTYYFYLAAIFGFINKKSFYAC